MERSNRRLLLLLLLLLALLLLLDAARAFNILGICPSTSYSHQQPFQALMKALARRGHKVTVISPVPLKVPVENYTDIDLSFTYKREDCTKLRFMSAFELLRKNMNGANALCEEQLFSRPIQELIERKEKFDAIIIEQLWYQCYYSLVTFYNYPVLIGFLSVGNLPYVMDSVGNPDDPFLNPDMAYAFAGRMNNQERVWNYIYTMYTRFYYNYLHMPRAQQIADKFTPGVSCSSIDRNFSLVILGNNHVFGYPKPLLPNVIEVHSLQITGDPGTLSKDIQEFLDGSSEGAIYFSLGSNLQSQQLPTRALKALSDAFGSIKQRVLWKYDGLLPVQAANIKFVKWAPQQAILAHPNTKVYMMQGGLQSIQEAVYYGIPLLALPFFGDQNFNGRKIIESKIGKVLHIDTMTKDSIVEAIGELMRDQAYSRNIQQMSAILKDEPIKPMDKAIWNVEHVLKFPGAQHLRYHGKDISFVEYHGTVIVLFFIIIIIVLTCIFSLYCVSATILKRYTHGLYNKIKKMN
ncbi:UDP-glucosyltransferase 2-like [Phymastichus coffea]|uniref:UDP-glucosyltransferase 2-like n=1 Tax=Phymastichus coffea TaxID=108790 RepID=UPI00273C0B6F|nr:UDP-glucosyltransferase 2-like [Phymastichus coffea]XP_058797200.1 UDP-glucosyltransferase 2-like [Phymastichus coffea]